MLMPPNSTRSRLTFASSGLVGVYNGRSVTSWPRASSSTASALSREQLPQYIPAAPAVMDRIFIAATPRTQRVPRTPRVQKSGRVENLGWLNSGQHPEGKLQTRAVLWSVSSKELNAIG